MALGRREFIRGAVASLFAAPAIVRYQSIMPVKAFGVPAWELATDNLLVKGYERYSYAWWDSRTQFEKMEAIRDLLFPGLEEVTSTYSKLPELDWVGSPEENVS